MRPFARRAGREERRAGGPQRGAKGDPSAPPAVSRRCARRAGIRRGRGLRAVGIGAGLASAPPLSPPPSPRGTRCGHCSKYGGVFHALPPPGFVSLTVVSPIAAVQALPRQQNFFVDSETSRKTPRQVTAECSGLSPAEEPRSRRRCSQITRRGRVGSSGVIRSGEVAEESFVLVVDLRRVPDTRQPGFRCFVVRARVFRNWLSLVLRVRRCKHLLSV